MGDGCEELLSPLKTEKLEPTVSLPELNSADMGVQSSQGVDIGPQGMPSKFETEDSLMLPMVSSGQEQDFANDVDKAEDSLM